MIKRHFILTTVLLSIIVLLGLYWEVFSHLNQTLFLDEYDGLKNYFNFAYHIKHDPSYLSFDGMHYPFGESIVMVDCHPLLSTILRFVNVNIVEIHPYSIGILNFIMLSSLVVTSAFVALILNYFGLHRNVITILSSIGIALLSSNALLWTVGHYALSYSFFFPMAWFFLLKYNEKEKPIRYSIVIALVIISFFYIHPYLGMINLGFVFLFHLFYVILNVKKLRLSNFKYFGLQVILPVMVILAITTGLDSHTGRIDMPFTADYRSSIRNVFLPNHSFLMPLYDSFFHLDDWKSVSWDRIGTYIGLVANIIVILFFIRGLRMGLLKRSGKKRPVISNVNLSYIFSSIALLIFAMALPYRLGIESWLPKILGQFVGLGRFSWAFFFVINVFCLKFISDSFSKTWKNLALGIAALIIFSEGLSSHLYLRSIIGKNRNLFENQDEYKAIARSVDLESFQAIIPLPFYHGFFSLDNYVNTEENKQLTMQLSYQSGLPLMGAMLSRPSVSESREILNIFNPPYYSKPIIKLLNAKPLLIVYSNDNLDPLEEDIIKRAQKIFESDKLTLYSLPVGNLQSDNNYKFLSEFIGHESDYYLSRTTGCWTKDSIPIITETFDDLSARKVYRGNGALSLKKSEENIVYKSNSPQFIPGVEYSLSFWYYNHLFDQTFNTVKLTVYNKEGGIISEQYKGPARSNVYDGEWAFNQMVFTTNHESDYIILSSKGGQNFAEDIYFDELLIRPSRVDVYQKQSLDTARVVFKNNEPIPFNF